MISLLGHLAIVLALLLALAGAAFLFLGHRIPDGPAWGRRCVFAVLTLVTLAVGLMEAALITHDFSVKYVAEHGSRETPLYYTIISLWGALEGSILFWVFLLSGFTALFVLRSSFFVSRSSKAPSPRQTRGLETVTSHNAQRITHNNQLQAPHNAQRITHNDEQRKTSNNEQRSLATGVLLLISSFFLFVIAWPGDPFAPVSPAPADGPGPNVLLQNHWMMGVHPVLLYLGYVGLTVPFAIAMAALLKGTPGSDVMAMIRRWSLVPWTFLSLGIVAGMWWSYAVLGWGGYWSWDPVENASVMPWLVTTAFLHSLQVQERRQALKTWTISLIVAAFLLSILGTFLTRSGILLSVHSFTQSAVGPLFLGFFTLTLVGSLGLLLARSRDLAAPGVLESTVCRETALLLNNLLLAAITFTILLGTLFPLIAEAAQGSQLTVGGPYFDRVAVPIGVALLFLMGIGPALPWGATRFEELQYRLLIPVAIGTATTIIALLLGARGYGPLLTFGAAGFVLAVTVGRVRADMRSRRRNTAEGSGRAATRLLAANPRRYGGYLAHVGVVLAFVGIAASQAYQSRALATVHQGQSIALAGYRLVYRGWSPKPEPNRMVIQARVDIYRGNRSLGTLNPSQNLYLAGGNQVQAVPTPGVREEPGGMLLALFDGSNPVPDLAGIFQGQNPFEDVYVVLDAYPQTANGAATFLVLVNPMVGFIWLGGLLLGLGGLVALVPARRKKRAGNRAAEPVRRVASTSTRPEEAVV